MKTIMELDTIMIHNQYATKNIEAKGVNGQLELSESVLCIKRKGILAFMTHGLKGDKEILISHISSIQFKNANFLMNGYIQFAFVGGLEAKRGIFEGTHDENTIMFNQDQQPAFEALRNELQRRISTKQPVDKLSSMDEIEKLASLRDKGIVSEDEFQKKKRELLGF